MINGNDKSNDKGNGIEQENNNNDDDIEFLSNENKEKLVQLLSCKICNGIFRLPMALNTCEHSFCHACIIQHIKKSTKELHLKCPICKINLNGNLQKLFTPNIIIQTLIETLFPEFTEINKQNRIHLYEEFRKIEQSLPNEREVLKDILKEEKIQIELVPMKVDGNTYALGELEIRTVKVAMNTTIANLQDYVGAKLKMNSNEIEILYKNMRMQPYLSLFEIKTRHKFNEQTVLQFAYMRKMIS